MKLFKLSCHALNPFVKSEFNTIGCKCFKVSEHKAIELEVYREADVIVDLNIEFSTKEDHAGLRLGLSLFSICFTFTFYDIRHYEEDDDLFD